MALQAEELGVRYVSAGGRQTVAVSGINLEVEQGEFVVVIGPSGCGKSTLLHCLGGLLLPTDGKVTFDGTEVRKPMPRQAAFVFQDYGLLPWKSVAENVALGLRFAGVPKEKRREEARRHLQLVGLDSHLDSYPGELSGGMQQRVAVARALCMEPSVLLLDEPFGAVDEQTRRYLGVEMSRILTDTQKSVVLVTHSLEEALFWGDRVIVMASRPGRIIEEIQVREPRPRSLEFMTRDSFHELRAHLFSLLTAYQPSESDDSERGIAESGAPEIA